MNKEDLMGLGFTNNQAVVYMSLIKFGKASANELIRDTKLHKKVVYENIEKLIDKGLAGYVVENKKRIFQATNPSNLVEIFNEKIAQSEKKKKQAVKIAKEIESISKSGKPKQEAIIYRGVQGIRTFYKELVKQGKDYVVFGAPGKSIDIMEEHFWLNFVLKKNEKRIKAKVLFNQSIKEYGNKIKDKYTQVKYFDKDFEPNTETNIQGNRVAIIVWSDEPILFLIDDKFVADSYLKYFNEMWKKSLSL